jgi:hypothetical protein
MRGTRVFLPAVAVIVTAMLSTPVGRADENHYLAQVADTIGVALPPSQALALGNTVCQAVRSAMANGMTLGDARHQADQAVGYAQQDMGLNLTMADGMHLVDAAVDQLC